METAPAYAHGILAVVSAGNPYRLTALNARTGKTLWHRRLPDTWFSSPSILDRTVYIGGRTSVRAFDLASGRRRWEWRDPSPSPGLHSSPTLIDGLAIVGSRGNSLVRALDQVTGRPKWQRRLHSGIGGTTDGFTAAADRAGHRVFVGALDHTVRAFDARTGRRLWSTDVGDAVWRGIAYASGRVLAITPVGLTCLDSRSGAVRWSRSLYPGSSPGMALANGLVIVGYGASESTLPGLRAFGLASGQKLLDMELGGELEPMGAAISRGRLYLPHWDRLLCLGLDG